MIREKLQNIPQCSLRHAISLLLGNDSELLDFVFSDEGHTVFTFSQELQCNIQNLPQQKSLLLKMAAGILNDDIKFSMQEIFQELEPVSFEHFYCAVSFLNEIHQFVCVCKLCNTSKTL